MSTLIFLLVVFGIVMAIRKGVPKLIAAARDNPAIASLVVGMARRAMKR